MRMTAPTRPSPQEFRHGVTRAAIIAFENRLRPYLQARFKGNALVNALPAARHPQEGDFLAIARVWSNLDPTFLALYQAAVIPNPQGYDSCISPGGHYVIYYTTNPDSADAVDPTDTMGFGPDSSNWRIKTSGPNGIPDYIDQVAWSCDSAWSMEVNRFGFIAPLSMTRDSAISRRYHFFVTETGDGYYGETIADMPAPGSPMGFLAHCEIRGNWTGPGWILNDSTLNYNLHPENAAHVTCVHENFHGIQFAMLWNNVTPYNFDNYPRALMEGTAVMMEHLGFNDIKDYLQYTTSFFDSLLLSGPGPEMSFFDGDNNLYQNSLLTIFLYEKAPLSPRIDFPKTLFFNNFDREMPFDTNLRITSGDSTFSTTWVGLLNRFHTGTYFTGPRTDTSRFDLDAPYMLEWTVVPDSSARSYSITKPVTHYAMQRFDYRSDTGSFDTLTITLACIESSATVPPPLWAASCIVLGPGLPDSVFPLPIDSNGHSSVRITGWHSHNEIIVIPTNGDPVSIGYATVSFNASTLLAPPAPSLAEPANGASGFGTTVTLSWNTSIGATSYAMQISTTSSLASFADNKSGITTLASTVTMLAQNRTYYWRVNATDVGGTSAWSSVWAFSTFAPLAIFPNPGHLSGGNNFIRFEGTGIQSVRIYSLDGNLVTNSGNSREGTFVKQANWLQWQLKNSQGKGIVPGNYRAVVEQRDSVAGINSTSVHKLLVFP